MLQCVHAQGASAATRGRVNWYVCCSVLQCTAVCYSVLQCVVVCGSVLQCVVLQYVTVCYSVL